MTAGRRMTRDELRAWGTERGLDDPHTLADAWQGVMADARGQWASPGEALAWLHGVPPALRTQLVAARVLCPGRELLLTAYAMPRDHAAVTAAHGYRWLMVPSKRAQMDGRASAGTPWWMVSETDTWRMQCRCHNRQMVVHPRDLLTDDAHADFTVVLT